MNGKLLAAILTIGTLVVSNSMGALSLEIDADNDQFRLTGSDTGTAILNSGTYTVLWLTDGYDGAFAYQDWGSVLFSDILDAEVWGQDDNTEATTGFQANKNEDFSTLSGSAIWVGYSGMGEAQKADFESLIGSSIPLATEADIGTPSDRMQSGWSPISVEAVPEAATLAFISVFCIGTLAVRRIFKI